MDFERDEEWLRSYVEHLGHWDPVQERMARTWLADGLTEPIDLWGQRPKWARKKGEGASSPAVPPQFFEDLCGNCVAIVREDGTAARPMSDGNAYRWTFVTTETLGQAELLNGYRMTGRVHFGASTESTVIGVDAQRLLDLGPRLAAGFVNIDDVTDAAVVPVDHPLVATLAERLGVIERRQSLFRDQRVENARSLYLQSEPDPYVPDWERAKWAVKCAAAAHSQPQGWGDVLMAAVLGGATLADVVSEIGEARALPEEWETKTLSLCLDGLTVRAALDMTRAMRAGT